VIVDVPGPVVGVRGEDPGRSGFARRPTRRQILNPALTSRGCNRGSRVPNGVQFAFTRMPSTAAKRSADKRPAQRNARRRLPPSAGLLVLAAFVSLAIAQFPGAKPTPAQIAQRKATEADHRYMMDILHLRSLRPGADPSNPNSPNQPNYDETKANPYPNLPDPLVTNDGRPVTSAEMWWDVRRPEIEQDFDREVYGYVPRRVPKVTWRTTRVSHGVSGGVPIVTRELIGRVDNSDDPAIQVRIPLTLTLPARAPGPAPVMMHFGFNFSPAMMKAFLAALKARGAALPPQPKGPTWQQQLLNAGWGYANLIPTSYQADNGAGLRSGIIGLVNHGQPRRPEEWGALRAWAWGASRALDYLETNPAVNSREVGIEGLSRYGKATLVTMAYDRRFAIALIGSSGKGGATLYRRHFGEEIGNLAGSGEYHWFAGNFLRYGAALTANDMPVDSHELIAMCAPRPIFISYGSPQVEGNWVDSRGAYMAAVAAGPVYELLGKHGLPTATMPPLGTALLSGDIAWRQHHGPHTDLPNWPAFLEFASHYFKTPPLKASPRG
jgi:hypothetical protein